MKLADAMVEGEEDLYFSDDGDSDEVSLVSDLDDDDLDEIIEKQKEMAKDKATKKKYVFHSVSVCLSLCIYLYHCF